MKKNAFLILIGCVFAVVIAISAFICSPEVAKADNGTDYSLYTSVSNFVINTQADFKSFASKYNANSVYNFNGKTVTLNCDVDLVDLNMTFTYFYGTFEGNGHKFYNQTKPLFDNLGTKDIAPQIKSLDFVNAKNTEDFALANKNYGTITDVFYWGSFAPVNNHFKGLVKSNFGVMQNCINFAKIEATNTATISGITEKNYGTIINCHFMGEINNNILANSVSKITLIAYYNYIENNTVSPVVPSAGIISNCTAVANIIYSEVTGLITNPTTYLVSENAGTISSCNIDVNIQKGASTTINKGLVNYPYLDSTLIKSYYAYGDAFGMYDLSGVPTTFTSDWDTYFIEDNLGTQFYYYNNIYPVNKMLFAKDGSSLVNSLALLNVSDVYKLKVFNGNDNIYAKMAFDCNLAKMPIVRRLKNNASIINFDGQNYAFYLSDKQFVFDNTFVIACQNLGCLATNTIAKISENSADDITIYYDSSNFNYGYSGGALTPIVPAVSVLGAGTRSDPYLISAAEDLAFLDNLEGYALLTNDIVINKPLGLVSSLPLTNLKVTLFGGGHSIIGIVNQSFTVNNYQTITDVFFRGYISSDASSIVSENNFGNIKNIKVSATVNAQEGSLVAKNNNTTISDNVVFGTVIGDKAAALSTYNNGTITKTISYVNASSDIDSASGIAYQNTGIISLVQNYGSANYGITANQLGTISNSINVSVSDFANINIGVLSSINVKASNLSLINNGIANDYTALDYFVMKNNLDYNMTTTFGYEINTFLNYPVLRAIGKKYKTEIANPFNTYSFINKTYNQATSYEISNIESYVKTGATQQATFTWKCNDVAYLESYLKNAATYVMTATYLGNATTLPVKNVQTFIINRAVPPLVLEYENLANINEIYSGIALDVITPIPSNITQLNSLGYIFNTSFTKNGTAIDKNDIILPSTYKQTIVYSNTNYFDLTTTRNIIITKKNMSLVINDYEIDYLQNIPWDEITVDISGLATIDSGKTVSQMIANYVSYVTSNYAINSNVGLYELSFSLQNLDCYTIDITKGKLTVKAIDLLQNGISFYSAISGVNGARESFYNGQIQPLAATNLYEGVSVVYNNNDSKNVGTYFPKAVFSKANYNNLELTVYFIIKKIPLSISVTNQTKNYGYLLDTAVFESTANGLVQGDTMQTVFVDRPFSYSVYLGDEIQQNSLINVDTYSIALTIGGNPAANYNVSVNYGTLIINKVDLQSIYKNNVQGVNTSFDNHTYTYNGLTFTREITYFENNNIPVSIDYKIYLNEILLTNNPQNAGTYTIIATVTPTFDTAINFITTTYSCIMVIDRKILNFAFTQEEYVYTYTSTIYALKENFAYVGFLPQGVVPIFSCQKDGNTSNGMDAGNHNLIYFVAATENYKEYTAHATLKILPKIVSVVLAPSYTFCGREITIEATINGAINNEIVYANLVFSYKNSSNDVISSIMAVGTYTVSTALSGNTNYALTANPSLVTVNPYNVYFEWGTIAYVYGTVGNFAYLGKNYIIASTIITLKNFRVEELNTTIDIGVSFIGNISGFYYVEESSIIQLANYAIYFTTSSKLNNINIIDISKRPLSVLWKIDNAAYYTQTYTGFYTGSNQATRWTYIFNNFAFNDNASNISTSVQVLGDTEDIYHVGDYTILLTILNNLNYVLTNHFVNVKIVKAELNISINDAKVEKGESYNYPSLTANGRRGADTNKRVESLDSANIRLVTNYTLTSPVGSIFDIGIVATFRNYQAVVIRVGKLTVIANLYLDYNLSDIAYVFDGTNKTVSFASVPSEIDVSYSNNIHKNAGDYTVSAVITYPSGRVKVSTCTLTIIKATPIISLIPSSLVYTDNRLLLSSDIRGSATYKTANIQGSFQFFGEWYLRLGEFKKYEISFTPDDTQNYNIVNSLYTMTSVEIDFSVLVFDDPLKFSFTDTDIASVTGQVVITLKNVMSGLKLYYNGNLVESIVLNKTETVDLQVRYNGETVFAALWEVTLIDTSSPIELEINENMLELKGAYFKNGDINVSTMGGRIALAEKYRNDYAMYVNGILLNEYIVNGNEEVLIIIIKSREVANLTLFAKEYKIETVIIEEAPIARDYKVYFIIGGSLLAAILLIALIVVIRKRRS